MGRLLRWQRPRCLARRNLDGDGRAGRFSEPPTGGACRDARGRDQPGVGRLGRLAAARRRAPACGRVRAAARHPRRALHIDGPDRPGRAGSQAARRRLRVARGRTGSERGLRDHAGRRRRSALADDQRRLRDPDLVERNEPRKRPAQQDHQRRTRRDARARDRARSQRGPCGASGHAEVAGLPDVSGQLDGNGGRQAARRRCRGAVADEPPLADRRTDARRTST